MCVSLALSCDELERFVILKFIQVRLAVTKALLVGKENYSNADHRVCITQGYRALLQLSEAGVTVDWANPFAFEDLGVHVGISCARSVPLVANWEEIAGKAKTARSDVWHVLAVDLELGPQI